MGQSALETGKKLYEDRRWVEAKKIFATIDDDQNDFAAARYYLGRITFDEKDFESAADYFEEALDTNDKIPDYHNWYGNALGSIAQEANVLRQGILAPKMKNAWEKAISLSPNMLEPRQSLVQYYLQAPGFMGGSTDKAKEMANQILKLDPADGHRQLGNIYLKEKKTMEAEKEFLAAVKINPELISVLANFYVSQKEYGKAFNLFEEEAKKHPDNMTAIYQIGRSSAISGQRLDRGEECLKKYLAYNPKSNEPSHAGANMRLAQIQEKRGHRVEAKKLYETALRLDGSLKEAKEGLERMSN